MGRFFIPALFILGISFMALNVSAGSPELPPAIISVDGNPGPKDIMMDIQPPKPGEAAECNFNDFIGRPVAEVKENARFLGRNIRILGEDEMVTQEYMFGRVNLTTDKAGIITGITCG